MSAPHHHLDEPPPVPPRRRSVEPVSPVDEAPPHGDADEPPDRVALVADVAHPRGENKEAAGAELAKLLDELDLLLARYVAFPSAAARHAVAAWVVHAHSIDAFESTPRLAVLSPEKGSGKTRVLEVLELVTPAPMHTVNVSAAALFRKVSERRCTLLLDEADTYLGLRVAKDHEDLRGLVNAGHRRGAVAYRCVLEKGVKVEEFPAFAPVALAGIGDLPDTIIDRSVVIAMKRRAPNEHVEPFRHRRASDEVRDLVQRLEVWSEANVENLEDLEPEMPAGIVDRPADVWEPLIMIGDFSGEAWSGRIRDAAVELNRLRAERDPGLGVLLLADCRRVFGDAERLSTAELLERLNRLDDAPWGDLRGEALTSRGLSKRLKPYGVKPADHRFGDKVVKGYLRSDFHDPWARYLPPCSPPGDGQQAQQAQPTDAVLDVDAYETAYPDLFGTSEETP